MQNVVVLGGSYGGELATSLLATHLELTRGCFRWEGCSDSLAKPV